MILQPYQWRFTAQGMEDDHPFDEPPLTNGVIAQSKGVANNKKDERDRKNKKLVEREGEESRDDIPLQLVTALGPSYIAADDYEYDYVPEFVDIDRYDVFPKDDDLSCFSKYSVASDSGQHLEAFCTSDGHRKTLGNGRGERNGDDDETGRGDGKTSWVKQVADEFTPPGLSAQEVVTSEIMATEMISEVVTLSETLSGNIEAVPTVDAERSDAEVSDCDQEVRYVPRAYFSEQKINEPIYRELKIAQADSMISLPFDEPIE